MSVQNIYDKLKAAIGNDFGVCGLMGNLKAESGMQANNLQNTYSKKFGMTDEQYTKAVDNCSYTNFVRDGAGYGLAQWTHWRRKQNLINYARSVGKSIGDEDMQIEFLLNEIKAYASVWNVLLNAHSVREASDVVLTQYERPANQNESVKNKRAKYGKVYYDKYAKKKVSGKMSLNKPILDFITWAMARATAERIPPGSTLCIDISQIGKEGKWEYMYGTTGKKCTQSVLDRGYEKYYKTKSFGSWSRAQYDNVTRGWVDRGVMVCDCQGLEDCFSRSDTNAKGNYARYCTDKGPIKSINRDYVIGEALFCGRTASSINHVGWVVGFAPNCEPLILHERGIRHGCVIEPLSKSGKTWTYRGLMTKRYEYDVKKEDTAAPTPSPVLISVGDIVQFIGGPVFRSSNAAIANQTRPASKCKVTRIYNGIHPYHLVSQDGKGVYGWVNAANVTK